MNKIIAIPSVDKKGLKSKLSLHFGHCSAYTVITIKNNKLIEAKAITNNHCVEQRTCMTPVQCLLDNGVQILITNSVGQRPFAYLNQSGIKIFYSEEGAIHKIIKDFLEGTLKRFDLQNICHKEER